MGEEWKIGSGPVRHGSVVIVVVFDLTVLGLRLGVFHPGVEKS